MIRALGQTVTLKPGEPLSKHDFLLPLSDLLLDLVENDLNAHSAPFLSQLGCALAHDFVNLATCAGQLLWLVDTAPVRTGTADSLSISLLAQTYLMHLRSACDVIAAIIHNFFIEEKKKRQVPKDSLNRLFQWIEREWIEKQSSRVPDTIKFILHHRNWFDQLTGIRDKLVHNCIDINIFIDGVAPQLSLMSTGDIHLHYLRKPRKPLENPLRLSPLLPFLKLVTHGALTLADQVTEVLALERKLAPSRTHVINGVYIPAIHHMLSYEEPKKREMTEDEKRRRKIKARYLLRAGDYLKAVNLGHPDGFWLPFVVRIEEMFGTPPKDSVGPAHPKYRDGEALIEWRLCFEKEGREYFVVLRDSIYFEADELEKDRKIIETFKQDIGAASIVLVSNATPASRGIPAERMFRELIMESDPTKAAERAFATLVGSEPLASR